MYNFFRGLVLFQFLIGKVQRMEQNYRQNQSNKEFQFLIGKVQRL